MTDAPTKGDRVEVLTNVYDDIASITQVWRPGVMGDIVARSVCYVTFDHNSHTLRVDIERVRMVSV